MDAEGLTLATLLTMKMMICFMWTLRADHAADDLVSCRTPRADPGDFTDQDDDDLCVVDADGGPLATSVTMETVIGLM